MLHSHTENGTQYNFTCVTSNEKESEPEDIHLVQSRGTLCNDKIQYSYRIIQCQLKYILGMNPARI